MFIATCCFALVFLCSYLQSAVNVKTLEYTKISSTTQRAALTEDTKLNNQLIKIAIIDTGYLTPPPGVDIPALKLCDTGHFNFDTKKPEVGVGYIAHGTIIGSIIAAELKNVNYCAVIYQIQVKGMISSKEVTEALNMASKEGITAVNVSLEGREYSFYERLAFKNLSDKGTLIFTAAGNRRLDLNEQCSSYPSCYRLKNIIVVGAIDEESEFKTGYSNYGYKVAVWYRGDVIWNGQKIQGTSFAAPRALSDFVYSFAARQVEDMH